MAIGFRLIAGTGGTYKASVRKIEDGVITEYWDFTNDVWSASDPGADGFITLSESPTGLYTATESSDLGTYTGKVVSFYHDNAGTVLYGDEYHVTSGAPTDLETQVGALTPGTVSAVIVADARTFRISGENLTSRNIVQMDTSVQLVLAASFSEILNDGTGLVSVTSVSVSTGSSLTISDPLVAQDRRSAHFTVSAATTGDRTVRVVVTTTDGQTLAASCLLQVV